MLTTKVSAIKERKGSLRLKVKMITECKGHYKKKNVSSG